MVWSPLVALTPGLTPSALFSSVQALQYVGGAVVFLVEDVPVHVQRQARVRAAEDRPRDLHRHPLGGHERDRRVPQVVEAHRRQPDPGEVRLKLLRDVGTVIRRPETRGEDEVMVHPAAGDPLAVRLALPLAVLLPGAVARLLLLLPFQSGNQEGRQPDHAHARRRSRSSTQPCALDCVVKFTQTGVTGVQSAYLQVGRGNPAHYFPIAALPPRSQVPPTHKRPRLAAALAAELAERGRHESLRDLALADDVSHEAVRGTLRRRHQHDLDTLTGT
jgi:hypothetical protein